MGISRQRLSQIERNLAIPSIIIALKISTLFEKRVEEIFYL
ncbi:TPA: helix-turn-helix domain-containing protein [Streptococcus suis]|nr:helix-turn-helix domain-containing protein [Streptococcus suis]HEM4698187.1 helix-turn-helix domain-containing protein [Streptococcus suis]HEM4702135.1 helix-turn-helix domain-containing protein [Streptococcus suis]HEM4702328.1 helix-turn-helix domain-containing protein [Streptococcus suis]HEM4718891.1 helix-turn-helix domain-containing protein [Streptococcus suis]